MLLLSSGAKAEEIYLNCKFETGTYSKGAKIVEPIHKGEAGTTDINIILDTRKKKIIEAPNHDSKRDNYSEIKFGGKDSYSTSWLDNEVKWSYSRLVIATKAHANHEYILNRRSGVLSTDFTMTTSDSSLVRIANSYQCAKQDKKF